MNKIKILTFQFAHNYGALLQCYALKRQFENNLCDVCIDTFIPQSVEKVYSLMPRIMFKHPRSTLNEIIRSIHRRKQYKIFESFIGELCEKNFEPELLVIGSDQVWNEDITGKISYYYGSGYNDVRKISYAGSFGTTDLSAYQKEMVSQYFSNFYSISVREKSNLEQVEKLSGKNVECVLDPVFLLSEKEWREFAVKPSSIEGIENYIFYYALRYDKDLVKYIKDFAKKMNCKVIAVHPTCINLDKEFIHLYDVGPKEFIYLLMNSKLVGTNSFHAMAFASIFKKKAIYKAYSKNESRIPDLLNTFDVECDKMNVNEYDFTNYKYDLLDKKIADSKKYINNCIK